MLALAFATAVTGWLFSVFTVITTGRDKADAAESYEHALAVEQARVDNLIAQIQANAQGFQHYPTLGPIEPEVEKRFLRDDTGLIEYEVDEDDDRDFAEAANV